MTSHITPEFVSNLDLVLGSNGANKDFTSPETPRVLAADLLRTHLADGTPGRRNSRDDLMVADLKN
jgi:hypothetical protein